METLDYQRKKSDMEAFYKGEQAQDWLTQSHIQWVIYGPYEKQISNSFTEGSQLEEAYKNDSVTIYKVITSDPIPP